MNHHGRVGRTTVTALRQALPYLRLYRGKTFVIKAGGAVFEDPEILQSLLEQIGVLHQVGVRVVFVHGGGPQTTQAAERIGIESRFAGGRRVTSPEMLEVATMVLNGALGTRAVAMLRGLGIPAVRVSGVDGGLVVATRRPPVDVDGEPVDFGQVGDVESFDPRILHELAGSGWLPVVSPLSADVAGQILNINADTIAAGLAVALGADKLVLATSVTGILEKVDDPSSLYTYLDLAELEAIEKRGVIADGMRPKVTAARTALRGGVPRVHMVSGRASDGLLSEIFTNEGSGTLLVADKGVPHADG